jgi:hypothetical protein
MFGVRHAISGLLFTSPLANLHEKASLVKGNMVTKAPTVQDETPLPRFHSHSIGADAPVPIGGLDWVRVLPSRCRTDGRPCGRRSFWRDLAVTRTRRLFSTLYSVKRLIASSLPAPDCFATAHTPRRLPTAGAVTPPASARIVSRQTAARESGQSRECGDSYRFCFIFGRTMWMEAPNLKCQISNKSQASMAQCSKERAPPLHRGRVVFGEFEH